MTLEPEDVARFYRVWFALLTFVNSEKQLVKNWPARFEDGVKAEQAVRLRDALWEDDALLARFVADNPTQLDERDLALVQSWKHRVAASFAILFKQLKKHAVVMTETGGGNAKVYAVLGLVSAPGEIAPETPIPVDLVLLPFEGRIIFDSILKSAGIYLGSGIRGRLNQEWRDIQDGRGLITSLPPDRAALRANIEAGNARLLKAFRAHLAGANLSDKMVAQHADAVATLAASLITDDPRPLLELDLPTAQRWMKANPSSATSIKRFARFLFEAERGDPERVYALQEVRRRA
jgi:hypothetical protein